MPEAVQGGPVSDRYFRPAYVSAFRTLAPIIWDSPGDPTVLGDTEINVEPLLAYLEEQQQKTGRKLTLTHAVARAVASVLGAHPDLNCLVRRGRIWMRRDVDVFCQVAVPHADATKLAAADLSGAVIRQADKRTTAEIAAELQVTAEKIRKHDDPMLKQTKKMLTVLPPFISRPFLRLLAYLTHDWGIDLTWMGVPDDPFGSVMVTSLGMYGIRFAYAPLFPNARAIGVLMVGQVHERAAVVNGQIVVQKALPLCIAMDHRIIDGFQASVFSREMIRRLEHPETLDDLSWSTPRTPKPQ